MEDTLAKTNLRNRAMHGIFFHFLKEYMQETYGGKDTWNSLLIANGYAYKVYFPSREYPDEELTSLVSKASSLLDIPPAEMLEEYGAFMVPRLLDYYSMYIKDPKWGSLELMKGLGGSIRESIIRRNPDSRPPEISTESSSPDHLLLHYYSQRRLCVLLKGMIRGVGKHYGESLKTREIECMHRGAAKCLFEIKRTQ